MARYFLELAYKGTAYAGFQKQENASTVQEMIEKAFEVYYRQPFELTGSSRTDAGVHALQNYFHFDAELLSNKGLDKDIYHINAILPADIVVKSLKIVDDNAHCRFDAQWRLYQYNIYSSKDPFLTDRAYYFPYTINMAQLHNAAALILGEHDFSSFSKKNTQAHRFNCTVLESRWAMENGCLIYQVKANRFLRGMVRALVATMLKVGRGQLTINGFSQMLKQPVHASAFFNAPAHGLTLMKVGF